MSHNPNTLKLVLTDHWFEEIKSGRKTHEYRLCNAYWRSRIYHTPRKFTETMIPHADYVLILPEDYCVEFQKAYRKNAEKMLFKVKSLTIHNGINTDLKIDEYVFDFELGERLMSTNPNTVKSQDDINEGGRKSDVLLSTIEELEKVKKERDRYYNALLSIQYETPALGGDMEDMEHALYNIDWLCDWALRPDEMKEMEKNNGR